MKKETLHNGAPSRTSRAGTSTRGATSSRIRACAKRSASASTSSGPTRTSCIRPTNGSSPTFPNTDMEAKGKPGPDELKLLEPFRDKLCAVRLRRSLHAPGQRRLGLRPRSCSSRPTIFCSRRAASATARTMMLPRRQAVDHRIPRSATARSSRTRCRSSRISASSAFRPISASSTPPNQEPHRSLRFRRRDRRQFRIGTFTPGVDLRIVYTSQSAAQNASRNLAGVSDPVVDALIEAIASAKSRE